MVVNYTTENKSKAKQHDNYTEDMKRDTSKEKTNCHACIFVGENEEITKARLCGKHIREVAEVCANGNCKSGIPVYSKYAKLYMFLTWIHRRILEKSGFEFKHR